MTDFVGGGKEDMRIRKLQKEREGAQKLLEDKKRQLQEEAQRGVQKMGAKFAAADDSLEDRLKKETIGLRSFDEYRRQRETLQEEVELKKRKLLEEEEKRKKKQKVTDTKKLSFSMDDDEQQEEEPEEKEGDADQKKEDGDKEKNDEEEREGGEGEDNNTPFVKIRITKNPLANTDFLPDREREMKEAEERASLAAEWRKDQEKIKQEKIEVTYSYWDGSGHRRTIKCKKGTTISQFLSLVQQEFKGKPYLLHSSFLPSHFSLSHSHSLTLTLTPLLLFYLFPSLIFSPCIELRAVSVDNLLFIKEDLIIPQQISFYDLIVTKARFGTYHSNLPLSSFTFVTRLSCLDTLSLLPSPLSLSSLASCQLENFFLYLISLPLISLSFSSLLSFCPSFLSFLLFAEVSPALSFPGMFMMTFVWFMMRRKKRTNLMQLKWWREGGMKETNTSSLLQDGKFTILLFKEMQNTLSREMD
jgi:protein FAM50